MAIETGEYARAAALSADEPWAAWVARGDEHDRRFQKMVVSIAAAAAVGVAVWLAFAARG